MKLNVLLLSSVTRAIFANSFSCFLVTIISCFCGLRNEEEIKSYSRSAFFLCELNDVASDFQLQDYLQQIKQF